MIIPNWGLGLKRMPMLTVFLDKKSLSTIWYRGSGHDKIWLGWGRKRSFIFAKWCARLLGGEIVSIEDGFLRSHHAGKNCPSLSLALDHKGIYYDASQSSDLEHLLENSIDLLSGLNSQVFLARIDIITNELSKYNNSSDFDVGLLNWVATQNNLNNLFSVLNL